MHHAPRRETEHIEKGFHCETLDDALLAQVIDIDIERELRLMNREELVNDPIFSESMAHLAGEMKKHALQDIAAHRFVPAALCEEILQKIRQMTAEIPKSPHIVDFPPTYRELIVAWMRSLCGHQRLQ